MSSVQAPHPSFGFYTSEEFFLLAGLCPMKHRELVADLKSKYRKRRSKYQAWLRKEEKQKKEAEDA